MSQIAVCDRIAAVLSVVALCGAAMAQPSAPASTPGAAPPAAEPARGARGPQTPAFVSPEVLPDHKIAFRIYAPKAEGVRVNASDIPGMMQFGATAQSGGTPPNQMT